MSHFDFPWIRLRLALAMALASSAYGVGALSGQNRTAGQQDGPLLVLAAASLADVLPAVAAAWANEGGADVRFSFDATSRLAPQVVEGAPADLFFSADQAWMDWLEEQGGVRAGTVRNFLGNTLVVVVPPGRSTLSGPRGLLALDRVALAGENVPAGRYAQEALEAMGLWDELAGRVVRGGSVRGALEWVRRGEVDAGLVYRTDARAQPSVIVAFTIPPETHREVGYPAAVLAASPHPKSAEAFLDFAAGPVGREIFREAGFQVTGAAPPPARTALPVASLPDPVSAVRISLVVALLATLAGLAPAVGLGWVLARREFRGKALVSTLVFAPLVLPPVVTGFLLLSLVGSHSPVGRALAATGVSIPFTLVGAALAAFVVGFPLYVLSVRGAFEAVDPHYEELSWTLGVTPWNTFRRVSLPLASPGIAAGAVLAFARALGEFGATVVLAGNVEGSTRTIALAVFTLLESPSGRQATWVLVGASVVLSLLALLGFEALSRRQGRRLEMHRGD